MAALLATACKVDDSVYSGEGFACSEQEPCADGFECLAEGICGTQTPTLDAGLDGGVVECLPPIELSDVFDGDLLGAQWTSTVEVGTSLSVADGVLQLVPATANLARFAQVRSEVFEFAERRVALEVPLVVNTATSAIAEVQIGGSELDYFFLREVGGVLQAGLSVAGVADVRGAQAYDEQAHRWWQFRRHAGQVFAEVASDGRTWTPLAAIDVVGGTDFAVTIRAGTEERVNEPGSLHIDNVNSGSAVCP